MKRCILAVLTTAALALGPIAVAQVAVVPEGGEASIGSGSTGRTAGTERTPGEGRVPGSGRTAGTGRTPGTGRTEGTGRTPGTGRTEGTGRVGLPATGGDIGSMATDAITLIAAGALAMRLRRRFA